MKKLILILLICLNSQALTYKNISLLDYAELVSHANQKEIFINEDIMNEKISFFIQKDINSQTLLDTFKYSLKSKGLTLKEQNNIFYVEKYVPPAPTQQSKSNPVQSLSYADLQALKSDIINGVQGSTQKEPIKIKSEYELQKEKIALEKLMREQTLQNKKAYSYDLQYTNTKDIDKLLKLHTDITYTFLDTSNSIVYFASKDQEQDIYNLIKKYDQRVKQKKIKLTVFSINQQRLADLGADFKNIGVDLQNYLNIFTSFGSTKVDLNSNNRLNIFTTLNFLIENGITKINQSPTLLLRSGEKVVFNSVKNIPYLVQKKEVTDNQSSTQDSYEYRDVGLKLTMFPKVFNDHMLVKFNLNLEDVLTNTITPTTSKISLQNTFDLKFGDVLLLSGLNRTDTVKIKRYIPILADIPYVGRLFKFDSTTDVEEVLTIMIEVIE